MINKPTKLPDPPDRICPGCGYRMSQLEVDSLRFNLSCPQCKSYKTSDFVRLQPNVKL